MLQSPGNTNRKAAERINVSQTNHILYWSNKLGISTSKLLDLVKRVGPYVTEIKKELVRERNA